MFRALRPLFASTVLALVLNFSAAGSPFFDVKSPHEILGVSIDASAEEIKKAYRRLSREHHPDLSAKADKGSKSKSHDEFIAIKNAYETLIDKAVNKSTPHHDEALIKKHGLLGMTLFKPAMLSYYVALAKDIDRALTEADLAFLNSAINGFKEQKDLRTNNELIILMKEISDRKPTAATRAVVRTIIASKHEGLTYMLMRYLFSLRAEPKYREQYFEEFKLFLTKASADNVHHALYEYDFKYEWLFEPQMYEFLLTQIKGGHENITASLAYTLGKKCETPEAFVLFEEILRRRPELFADAYYLPSDMFYFSRPGSKPEYFFRIWDVISPQMLRNFDGIGGGMTEPRVLMFYDLLLLKNDVEILKVFASDYWLTKLRWNPADPVEVARKDWAAQALAIEDATARFDFLFASVSEAAREHYEAMGQFRERAKCEAALTIP